MKKLLIFVSGLLVILLIFTNTFAFAAAGTQKTAAISGGCYNINAPAYASDIALLMNADTDTVIYSKNADMLTAPASLTKLVTALVVLSKCDNLSTVITCSDEAIHSLDGTGSSVAGLHPGENVSLEMMLYCLFLPSANDAAIVLAEHFGGGDVAAFVAEMNAFVVKLGCKNTHFANPHGLDDESVPAGNYTDDRQDRTTASDMYLIAKAALKNQTIRKISSKYGKTMPATNKNGIRYLYNTNLLLNEDSYYHCAGIVGLKTGTTDKAGSCLITSATKNGYTYIAIAMHGKEDYVKDGEKRNTAFLMCRYMLNWAFQNMSLKVLADTSYNMGEVSVQYGRGSDYVALVPAEDITSVVHNDVTMANIVVKKDANFPKQIKSPVKKGDAVGKASLYYKGMKVATVTLVAQNTVRKNYVWAIGSTIKHLLTSKKFLAAVFVLVILFLIWWISTKKKRELKKRRKFSVEVVKDYSKLSR